MKSRFKKILLYGLGGIVLVLIGLIGYVKIFLPDVAAAPYLKVEIIWGNGRMGRYSGLLLQE